VDVSGELHVPAPLPVPGKIATGAYSRDDLDAVEKRKIFAFT
jgi:hypothetical protein